MEGRIWTVLAGCLAALYVMSADEKVLFPEEPIPVNNIVPVNITNITEAVGEERRNGKNLLDWLGFGVGGDTDPYLARANSACLEVFVTMN